MSDPQEGQNVAYRGDWRRKPRSKPYKIDGLPTPEELDAQPHRGDAADRFSLYTPEQIEALTKNAKIEMSFKEPIKIRDQAEMIVACMQIVLQLTRQHKVGSIRQRIETRREIASLVERLTMLNGKTPYGYRKKAKR